MIDDQQLREWNSAGIFAGPADDEQSLQRRAKGCLHQESSSASKILPNSVPVPTADLQPALNRLSTYDIHLNWVEAVYSNNRLPPWHGAITWITEEGDGVRQAVVQVSKKLHHHKTLWGLYSRDELIAHELIHVARMAFDEPKYEEILAYATSQSAWRQWTGPLIQSNAEAIGFLASLTLPYLAPLWTAVIPIFLLISALARTARRQKRYQQCLIVLQTLLITPSQASAVALRMTDREIELFAKQSVNEAMRYIESQQCLRWKTIRLCYLYS